jgi:hypothetical protein
MQHVEGGSSILAHLQGLRRPNGEEHRLGLFSRALSRDMSLDGEVYPRPNHACSQALGLATTYRRLSFAGRVSKERVASEEVLELERLLEEVRRWLQC